MKKRMAEKSSSSSFVLYGQDVQDIAPHSNIAAADILSIIVC